jgi:hypothetical protein
MKQGFFCIYIFFDYGIISIPHHHDIVQSVHTGVHTVNILFITVLTLHV